MVLEDRGPDAGITSAATAIQRSHFFVCSNHCGSSSPPFCWKRISCAWCAHRHWPKLSPTRGSREDNGWCYYHTCRSTASPRRSFWRKQALFATKLTMGVPTAPGSQERQLLTPLCPTGTPCPTGSYSMTAPTPTYMPGCPSEKKVNKVVLPSLYRPHTAILNRPLSSAATMEVQGPDTT